MLLKVQQKLHQLGYPFQHLSKCFKLEILLPVILIFSSCNRIDVSKEDYFWRNRLAACAFYIILRAMVVRILVKSCWIKNDPNELAVAGLRHALMWETVRLYILFGKFEIYPQFCRFFWLDFYSRCAFLVWSIVVTLISQPFAQLFRLRW